MSIATITSAAKNMTIADIKSAQELLSGELARKQEEENFNTSILKMNKFLSQLS